MYRKKFIHYLKNVQYEGPLQQALEYLLKNEQASYIRAQLTLAWCDEYNGNIENALPLALAIECIHTSSLIQDDLPCMDNSAERRGLPSMHIHFNESTAILTSDILINAAYYYIIQSNLSESNKCKTISILSNYFFNLCNGQYLDLHTQPNTLEEYISINELKTSSLLSLACAFGTIAANADDVAVKEAINFGKWIGIAYQIKDDIKDSDGITKIISQKELDNFLHNINIAMPHYENLFIEKVRGQILC